ncbi:hypothetical protein DFP72DRAFT_861259 [Ephemerocybe angulata]|uniref:Uncharacterized protein n=1 Tax=Ephemerocybe angulata TaxID=980116 RepID=A0A8H6HA08_9AGAR|nr:hypothetical protein DFP72DRAFT_861259 [Tulosesus angulatus]
MRDHDCAPITTLSVAVTSLHDTADDIYEGQRQSATAHHNDIPLATSSLVPRATLDDGEARDDAKAVNNMRLPDEVGMIEHWIRACTGDGGRRQRWWALMNASGGVLSNIGCRMSNMSGGLRTIARIDPDGIIHQATSRTLLLTSVFLTGPSPTKECRAQTGRHPTAPPRSRRHAIHDTALHLSTVAVEANGRRGKALGDTGCKDLRRTGGTVVMVAGDVVVLCVIQRDGEAEVLADSPARWTEASCSGGVEKLINPFPRASVQGVKIPLLERDKQSKDRVLQSRVVHFVDLGEIFAAANDSPSTLPVPQYTNTFPVPPYTNTSTNPQNQPYLCIPLPRPYLGTPSRYCRYLGRPAPQRNRKTAGTSVSQYLASSSITSPIPRYT